VRLENTAWQATCGLYCLHITIVNADSSIINKLETSLTDDIRVIIYDHHMFEVQATAGNASISTDGTAYFVRVVSIVSNMFMKSTTGVKLTNFFYSLMLLHYKLECLYVQ
jgi:hypothetical protein